MTLRELVVALRGVGLQVPKDDLERLFVALDDVDSTDPDGRVATFALEEEVEATLRDLVSVRGVTVDTADAVFTQRSLLAGPLLAVDVAALGMLCENDRPSEIARAFYLAAAPWSHARPSLSASSSSNTGVAQGAGRAGGGIEAEHLVTWKQFRAVLEDAAPQLAKTDILRLYSRFDRDGLGRIRGSQFLDLLASHALERRAREMEMQRQEQQGQGQEQGQEEEGQRGLGLSSSSRAFKDHLEILSSGPRVPRKGAEILSRAVDDSLLASFLTAMEHGDTWGTAPAPPAAPIVPAAPPVDQVDVLRRFLGSTATYQLIIPMLAIASIVLQLLLLISLLR